MPIFDTVMRYFFHLCLIILSAFCFTNCSVFEHADADVEKSTLVGVGDIAPDFTAELLDGSSITFSQLQGNTVLLVFFDTTCPECQLQLALLDGVVNQFAARNFSLLAVNRGQSREEVTQFAEKKGYNFNIALDPDATIYSLYATQYVPRCFIIDPLGRLIARSVGYSTDEFDLLKDVILNNLQN